jgi:hypothetical protein
MVRVVTPLTGTVLTAKVVLTLPPGTVTLAGTVAANVLLLVSVTRAPPEGAAPLKVTVPWELFPPVTLDGFRLTALTVMTIGVGVTVRSADWELPA